MTISSAHISDTVADSRGSLTIDGAFMGVLRDVAYASSRDTDTMSRLADAARAITGVDHVAIVAVSRVRKRAPSMSLEGASGFAAEHLSLAEFESPDGPVHRAASARRTVICSAATNSLSMPTLFGASATVSVRSVIAVPLMEPVHSSVFAVATFWSDHDEVVADDVRTRATAVTDLVTLVMSAATARTQFEAAIASRDIIGQAKGRIMERYDIGPDEAFDLLARLSQDTNTPLATVAAALAIDERTTSTAER